MGVGEHDVAFSALLHWLDEGIALVEGRRWTALDCHIRAVPAFVVLCDAVFPCRGSYLLSYNKTDGEILIFRRLAA